MHSRRPHVAFRFTLSLFIASALLGCSPGTLGQSPTKADCIHTYNFPELDVFGSLCRSDRTIVASIDCGYQRAVLDELAGLPISSRDQNFDRALDAAQTDGP